MSQDELAIRVVLDPTQFREEFLRLRRELEEEERIEAAPRERRAEAEIIEQPTVVRVAEDTGLRQKIESLEKTVDLLKVREGLPAEFGALTLGEAKRKLAAAIQAGWFDAPNERLQGIVDKALERYVAGLDLAIERLGPEQIVDALAGGEWSAIRGGVGELMDTINRRFREGRLEGLNRESRRFLSRILTWERVGGEGWAHRMEKALSEFGFRAAGKEEDMVTEFPVPGPEGTGVRGGGRFDVMAMFDIATVGERFLRGGTVVEAAGRWIDMQKAGQLARYTHLMLRELFYQYYPERRGSAVDPEEITEWVREVIPQIQERGKTDFLKVGLLGIEGRVTSANVTKMADWLSRQSEAIRLLKDAGLFETPLYEIPEDIAFEALERNARGILSDAEVGAFVAGRIEQTDPQGFQRMQDFFNVLIGITPTQYRTLIRETFNSLVNRMAESGGAITPAETGRAALLTWAQLTQQTGAAGREQREAMLREMPGVYPWRGPVPEGFDTEIMGRLYTGVQRYGEETLFGRVVERRRALTEREEIQQTLRDMAAISPEHRELLQRAVRLNVRLEEAEVGSPLEELIREEAEELRERIEAIPERREPMGVGMEIDPREYRRSMERVARRMGFTYQQLVELEQKKEAGILERQIQTDIAGVARFFQEQMGGISDRDQLNILNILSEKAPTFLRFLEALTIGGGITEGEGIEEALDVLLKREVSARVIPDEYPQIVTEITNLLKPNSPTRQMLQREVGLLSNTQQIMDAFERLSTSIEPMTGLAFPWQ